MGKITHWPLAALVVRQGAAMNARASHPAWCETRGRGKETLRWLLHGAAQSRASRTTGCCDRAIRHTWLCAMAQASFSSLRGL